MAPVRGGRLADSFADLPEHERLAALTSVQDTFAAADEPDAGRLFALELDPERLRAELSAPAAGLSARAVDLYEDLLRRCCAHLVEQLTAHPSFAARAAVEQVRATGRTRELVEDVRDRVGGGGGARGAGWRGGGGLWGGGGARTARAGPPIPPPVPRTGR
ncbi:hypothetical protein ACFWIP_33055 [Streptomyces anulatus]|uniref:NACHT N-terminal Helical domain 1-containing protein n=1 Tax=Streptomyces anulatus TaxID=1892 RepID=UPI003652B0A6